MLNIISENPYRFLGVYANSPIKERVANANKLKAYLKVGKEISFPMDTVVNLSKIERSSEKLETANAKLNIPVDQIKYGMFWFINDSPIDNIALEHLRAGNVEKCLEIFAKKESFSSCINLALIYALQNDLDSMIKEITRVIKTESYRVSFVNAIVGEGISLDEEQLATIFIESLEDEVPLDTIQNNSVSGVVFNIAKERGIETIRNIILSAISEAKDTENTPSKQYAAGEKLIKVTKEPLMKIKLFLGTSDIAYQTLVDKLATQILQCGINFFNKCDADDEEEFEKAYRLQSFAASLAIGKLVKDRCNENVSILDKRKNELAPKGVRFYDKKIKAKLVWAMTSTKTCDNAIELVKACAPYLASIKEELGPNHEYYLNISTIVVAAGLSKIIDEFNSMMNKNIQLELMLNREATLNKLRRMFKDAWRATLYLEKLDMEADFKNNRFNSQKLALRKQVVELIELNQSVSLKMESDSKMFASCKTSSDYKKYMEVFGGGKHACEASKEIERLAFEEIKTTKDCEAFAKLYPNSRYPISDKWETIFYQEADARGTIEDYQRYLQYYPNGKFTKEANENIDRLSFERCDSVVEWNTYLRTFPHGAYRANALSCIEEEKKWHECIASEDKEKYKQYLSQYPNGRHRKEAEKKASACYVATMVYGDYNHPQVIALRGFRDNVLRSSAWGQAFIRFYYRNSPAWVEKMQGHRKINKFIREMLNIFIKLYNHECK